MKVLVLSAGLVCVLLLVGCGEKVQAPDPVILPLFQDVTVHFTPCLLYTSDAADED